MPQPLLLAIRRIAISFCATAVLSCAPETAPPAMDACVSDSPRASIDHVTLAVSNLTEARTEVQDLGFRIKEGRLHPNGILNAHAKTRSGSLELLTIADGGVADAQSQEYEEFLSEGEGGAFLALGASPVDSVAVWLEPLGVAYDIERGAAWDYLTFPRDSALRHIYFFDLKQPPDDGEQLLTHMNGASGISGVALDGDPELIKVLEAVGATVCEVSTDATRLLLGNVALSVLPQRAAGRGRIRGVQFDVFTLGRPPAEVRGLTLSWTTPN